MRSALIIGAALASTGLAYSMWLAADDVAANTAGGVLVQVALPDTLSENAQIGKRAYEANSKVIQTSDEMLQTANNVRR